MLYSCQRASRGKFNRIEIVRFNQSKLFGLSRIHTTLSQNAYSPSPYNHFYINDPKPRSIMSLPFTDRIIHQWVVEELIKPYYVPRFIAQTYACIPGRGTHAAVCQAQLYLRRSLQVYRTPYIIKLDIAQFFHSIDTPTLFTILQRDIDDSELLKLLRTIIFTGITDSGLPIGNYTSQYFANIYLNELDQYVKRTLHVKLYVRYMDDFLCFVDSKSEAKRIYRAIERFLHDELRLQLNPKSRYFPAHHSLDFCGYKIYPRYLLLRDRSKRRLCQIIEDFEKDLDSEERFEIRVNAWLGHALHASSYTYATKKLGPYATRFDRLAPEQKSSS